MPGNWRTYLAGTSYLRLREFPASRLVITAVLIGPETAVALVQLRHPAIFRPMPLKPGDSPRYIRHLRRCHYILGFSAKTVAILGTRAGRISGSPDACHRASRHLPDLTNVRLSIASTCEALHMEIEEPFNSRIETPSVKGEKKSVRNENDLQLIVHLL